MKKLNILIIALIALLCGCQDNMAELESPNEVGLEIVEETANNDVENDATLEQSTDEYSFFATVVESYASSIVVEPYEDEEIRKSSDRISIGLGEHNDCLFMVGTNLKITFNGNIMETYPAQIEATKIELKSADDFEILFYDKQSIESSKIYTILEAKETDKYNYSVYGYDGSVNIRIDGKDYSLRDALLQNKITMEEIIVKANIDIPNAIGYDDGGSVEYHYDNYTIIKCHSLDGNRDVYIGRNGLTLNDLNI